VGQSDLYVATRPMADSDWETVEHLGTRVNTAASEWGPCISADGLKLYFSSDRADGYGGHDLWVTTRESPRGQWGPAANLGPTVNGVYDEIEPSISLNDLALYFSDGGDVMRAGPLPTGFGAMRPGTLQTWMVRRATTQAPWGQPESLDPQTNVGLEVGSCISSDGLTLPYAGALRPEGPWALYAARRTATSEPFGLPVELAMGARAIDPMMPSLSADGEAVYFVAVDVEGGESWDLWEAELTPIVDLNGDGRVNGVELARMAEHWGSSDLRYDIAPMPCGDGFVDAADVARLAEYAAMDEIHDPTLVGRWKLDGHPDEPGLARDCSENGCHGILIGDACLLPDCGMIDGALQCDGYDDYVVLPTSCNAGDGELSVFAWVNGGRRGKVILSQRAGVNWLMADQITGALKTELGSDARFSSTLQCDTSICDGTWHEIGLVWDGTNRSLYVDGVEVAHDAQVHAADCWGSLYLGASDTLHPGSFWSGLIDDVRIYNRAVIP
jgi:hypothetical protein